MTIRAHEIKKGLAERHADDFFMTEVKNGPTWAAKRGQLLQLDAIAIKRSWTKPCITGYEVKVSRNDFLNDEKWPAYMQYCHRFYFACPKGLIQPEELPDEVGLLWYSPEYNTIGNLHTKRKALFRNIEISKDMLYYIIICRLEKDRHPFFSDEREMLQMWVEDKVKREQLAWQVKSKIFQDLYELEERARKAENTARRYKEDHEMFQKVVRVLNEKGLSPNVSWFDSNWEEELMKVITSGVSKKAIQLSETILRYAQQLLKVLGGESDEK